MASRAKKAMDVGVTEAELPEALGVAAAMNAGAARAYSGHAMDASHSLSGND
nr:hypothetical protein [Paraburkholderia humisilvae]